MDTRKKGKEYEDLAALYIEKNGGKVIERNFYFQGGEIDIIAWDTFMNQRYLCFIEVKARKNTDKGHPLEAVTYAKRNKIIKGARTYLNYRKFPQDTNLRFDVVSILQDEVEWVKNAFGL